MNGRRRPTRTRRNDVPEMADAKQQLDEAQQKANQTGESVTVYADGQPVVTVRPEE